MGIEEEILAALLADPTVAGLVEARVYATNIPPNDTPPPWLYFLITDESPTSELGRNDRSKFSVEFELFAATYGEARSLKLAIRAVLNTYIGGPIGRMLWSSSDSGPVENGHSITERYSVYPS